ncbi:TPA: XRE family transcriptional regulator [Escherichia coli]|nr:XRE family transcriptional regulator [Escherichia coli]HAX5120659.1 XRE family transcriptional regulator [Escherichia coli]HAX5130820.1 XRE family transcriptional regulator [Escherichia coli]HAX5181639.1 XRE family transcriptional regulator [Escherichia coli]HAX5228325.1 XRE family transcriptional regulator [Escherichia coli]
MDPPLSCKWAGPLKRQRTWHAWENAEQVDVTVWRTTQALSVRDLLPHMQGMRKADIIRRLENELGETAGNV